MTAVGRSLVGQEAAPSGLAGQGGRHANAPVFADQGVRELILVKCGEPARPHDCEALAGGLLLERHQISVAPLGEDRHCRAAVLLIASLVSRQIRVGENAKLLLRMVLPVMRGVHIAAGAGGGWLVGGWVRGVSVRVMLRGGESMFGVWHARRAESFEWQICGSVV